MSESLQPPTPLIKDWLAWASNQLVKAKSPSAKLDAELILTYVLDVNRTYLHAHYDDILLNKQLIDSNSLLGLRQKHIPIAYIVGNKEFYNRSFFVTPAVLIPRPESEDIIDILKQVFNPKSKLYQPILTKLVDVGTGSGCLGITAKLEVPTLDVTILDISNDALEIAKKNAHLLSANVKIISSNLLQKYKNNPDIIIANLPYVDKTWTRSPETDYEPKTALFADDNGQQIIKKLINQAKKVLSDNGLLILEADPAQHDSLIDYAKKSSMNHICTQNYIMVFKKSKLS